MKAKELQELAKIMYLKIGLSQAEIAKRTGKTKSQISRWVKSGNWKLLRSAVVATTDEIIQRTYAQVSAIYDAAEEEGRTVTTAEADQIVKLTSSIKDIKKGVDLSAHIEVLEAFTNYLREQDHELSKEIVDYQMDFLTIRATEMSKK